MKPTPLPALRDNCIWMLEGGPSGSGAVVVDPGDAAPMAKALGAPGVRLTGILVTHRHPDPVGTVDRPRARDDGPVSDPARETIPTPFMALREGDAIDVPGLRARVIGGKNRFR